ncbi:FAD:protein FMN transferase [Marinimicrobium koreense]|uniref:FAD:protein FMN transferase n=1 Tax=Marinimicrobium koreense TaxID=306545 RepID=UPI001FE3B397|nr:FAD:protein FMN transferase [Marinimicrobium koreense]
MFLGLLLGGCEPRVEHEAHRFSGPTMGTTFNVTLVVTDQSPPVDAAKIQAGLERELAQINQQMSTYIDDSELMQFNRSKVGQWQSLSAPLAEVLAISRRISERSEGAFDITVGPLVDLWGFGPLAEPEQVPSDVAIAAARSAMGYAQVALDGQRARRLSDVRLDLSAVAKGYGVDHLADWLEAQGYEHYLVEIGGEVRLSGDSPRGDAWRIGVEQPSLVQGDGRKALALTDIAMATSGDYRNYYERDGVRYSHTIDPRTGRPIAHRLASVTVLAPTSAEADAWATALNVLGPEAGMALAEREKLPVYMIVKTDDGFTDDYSSAFAPWR